MIVWAAVLPICGQMTLEAFREKAKAYYPLSRQFGILETARKYSFANANRGYLPQITLSGKMLYQSDATEIPKLSPMMPSFSANKDQYQVAAEISQVVWDGGAVRARKEIESASIDVEREKLQVDLHELDKRVEQIFFGIVLISEQIVQNDIFYNELCSNYEKVSAYVTNGVANQADIEAIMVEKLSAQQQRIELLASRRAYCEMLSKLVGEEVSDTTVLTKPEVPVPSEVAGVRRSELDLFNAQQRMLESRIGAIGAGVRPKISLFLQCGYGRPGLDMLDNDFSEFAIGGIRLAWGLSGFYTKRNDIKKVELEMDKVETLRETFLVNTACQVKQERSDIDKYRALLGRDDEIIALRANIRKAAEAKVANGTMTISDLLNEINAEHMARQIRTLHEVHLIMAAYALRNTLNQ